ncbi:hypothetical protein ACJX0J_017699, partial [Zea mays]
VAIYTIFWFILRKRNSLHTSGMYNATSHCIWAFAQIKEARKAFIIAGGFGTDSGATGPLAHIITAYATK